MKKVLKLSYMSLFVSSILFAGPADSVSKGPNIGGTVSDSSENKGTTISIGGAKFSQSGPVSKNNTTVGNVGGTETDIGNIKIKSGTVTGSVTNSSTNEGTTLNIGTKVQKGSINMTKGSVGSIVNSATNNGTTISIGGGKMKMDTAGISNTSVEIGSTETKTNIGSINVDGGKVLNEISNAGMKNEGTTVNIGGEVNKGAISTKGGQAKSIQNSSQNTGTIVNIGGGKFNTESMGGLSKLDVQVGSQKTVTDVGSVKLNSGLVKGDIQITSTNSATVVNVGSTVKEGSIEIGE